MNIHEWTRENEHGRPRNVGDFVPRPAEVATDAAPGSFGKLAVLCERAEEGVELWHESDTNVLPDKYQAGYTNDWYTPHDPWEERPSD